MFQSSLTKSSAAVTGFAGSRNIHAALVTLGMENFIAVGSGIMFAALGAWTYRYRRVDRWVLVAVAALVARTWTYHRVYDDVLILLAELALFRIARQHPSSGRAVTAEILMALSALAMLCPARLLDEPGRWSWIFTISHSLLWILMLIFLVNYARQNRHESARMTVR